MKSREYKRFYLNWKWYYYVGILLLILYMFVLSIKYGIINEGWYMNNKNETHALILSYDAMNSFFTTHVNFITAIWLIVIILQYDKINPSNSWARICRNLVLNLNLMMFIGFLIGLIFNKPEIANQLVSLEKWTTYQAVVTIVIHFIIPLALVVIYFFEQTTYYYEFKKIKSYLGELLIANIYPCIYLGFISTRSIVYKNAGIEQFRFVYGFLNFEKPLIGSSSVIYFILLLLFIIFSTTLTQMIVMFYNNICFNIKNKYFNTDLKDKNNKIYDKQIVNN
ncbi:hypothetical protein NX779_00420 [Mycoplasma cottewii]|uniref:DUF1600 domain-containing protein n=1 Tax=Mycoplasma cottewii TaxID=51364 RepID=A0ABY5TZS1_9MOLU|nr:hypothetical protein [Mycoplasma cottewii]UWD35111.1 hypothetical protein NX779_00420 [Mycoplasma cottewii]